MALILCPECGKEISDKCETCIHCGFPLINTKCNINGIIYDFKEELPIALLEKTDDYVPAIGRIRRKTSLSLVDGCNLVEIIKKEKSIPPSFTPKYPLENLKELENAECPYCRSTDTEKITNTSKVIHTAIFGLFSVSRNSKNFHCNNCNSDF